MTIELSQAVIDAMESAVNRELLKEALSGLGITLEEGGIIPKSRMTNQDKQVETDVYKKLEGQINEILRDTSESFMLTGPMTLTVLKRDGKYSRMPHVGGEDFRPEKAYFGKRGSLIIVFRPVMSQPYEFMEMTAAEAKQHMLGFTPFYRDKIDEAVGEELQAAKAAENEKAAEKTHEERATKYNEYGSW